jgi:hypothetical protein
MPSLELKFFVHCGNFIVQHVAGIKELVGSDVNLAHRLMKNHITDRTGWKAYSLFTNTAIEHMQLQLEDVHKQSETYEHLGDIETITINLIPRYDAMAASRQHYLTVEDADVSLSHPYNISEVELWQILTSMEILTALMNNTVKWKIANLIGGRTDVGATSHCLHGKGIMRITIVDWHPFTYFTGHGIDGRLRFYQMSEIQPLPDGESSMLHWRWQADMGMPRWLNKILGVIAGRMSGTPFFKSIKDYIENVQKPTFQPEAE